jgi:hypothetical protein
MKILNILTDLYMKLNFSFNRKVFNMEFKIPKIEINTNICKKIILKFDVISRKEKIFNSFFLITNDKGEIKYKKQIFFSNVQNITFLIDSNIFLDNNIVKFYFKDNKYQDYISIQNFKIFFENKFICKSENFLKIHTFDPTIEWEVDSKLNKLIGKCIFGTFFLQAKSLNKNVSVVLRVNNLKLKILEKLFLIYPLHYIGLNNISEKNLKDEMKQIKLETNQSSHTVNFISFSGGLDSSALSSVFPDYKKFTYVRSYSKYCRSDGKLVNLNEAPYNLKNTSLNPDVIITGDIEKFYINIGFIRNKFPSLLFYGYLLIPFINYKNISISFGHDINEVFFKRGINFIELNNKYNLAHLNYPDSGFSSEEYNFVNLLLSQLGVRLYLPLAGSSEYINFKILELNNLNYSFCPYFNENDEPCNNCIKCFRKNLILNKIENLKKFKKNYILLVEKLFSHMTLSAMQSVNNLTSIKNPKNFINIINKYYEKALLELANSEQQKKLFDIYHKINVKKISKNDELIMKNIEIKKVNKLIRKFKNNLIKKILV